MHTFMKNKLLFSLSLLAFVGAAQGALIINQDFSNSTGTEVGATSVGNQILRNGANDSTGLGWLLSSSVVSNTSFPEPSTYVLLLAGVGGLIFLRRRAGK